ncbi:decarbamoylnovobiocin carbamoyltransferase [mine drainage metagenome]|uniref:Decarbamoylnovobiocin carbamoyltransferase n=1 Tax=mine drainage metagenome TaxID=410659 RepID=A0A1J5QZX4_9ZZZZ
MRVLGLSAAHADSAAVLAAAGRVVAAAQEERFSRGKHDAAFPARAAAYCLEAAGPDGLAAVERVAVAGGGDPGDLTRHLKALDPGFDPRRLYGPPLDLCHAAGGFLPSPFDEALVLVLDDGDGGITVAEGRGDALRILEHHPQPLGWLYAAVTAYLGFKPGSGEYKVMGLAPYGEPRFAALLREHLLHWRDDGLFTLAPAAIRPPFHHAALAALLNGPPRPPEAPLSQRHMDVAASLQHVTEQTLLRLVRALAARHPQRALCLAGGMALNCVANGKLLADGAFRRLWIQPAAGRAGAALGAALLEQPRPAPAADEDGMEGGYLGPSYEQPVIEAALRALGAVFTVLDEPALLARAAADLAAGKALGWFQGRMEFGPRALGARSILADPRHPAMQSRLNLKIKYRESFRPFAPAVLAEEAAAWFDLPCPSPYMLLVAPLTPARRRPLTARQQAETGLARLALPRSELPAVTHVDGSARVQTVDGRHAPRFRALLEQFFRQTGCPVLVNTSFNVRGEPIVATPDQAFACFMGTGLDALALGNCYLEKHRQPQALRHDASTAFPAD